MKKPFSSETSQFQNTNQNSNQSKITNIKIENYSSINQTNKLSPSDFIRTSSEVIPSNQYLIRYTGIPFGVNLTPFPDIDSSLLSQYSFGGGNGTIPRCSKCKSFYNPFCLINDNYTSYKCNICFNTNELKNIDEKTLKKIDDDNNNVYEIFANSDYIENSPMSSNYVFILDFTNKSINSGAIKTFFETLRYIINNKYFVNEERTFISFITFNHSGVNFYKINKKNNSIQILEISGDEPFVPDIKKNLIFPVDDNLDMINILLDCLENLYNNSFNNNSEYNKESEFLIFAIECGKVLLKNKGGKLLVINSSTLWKNKIEFYQEINKQNNTKSIFNNFKINLNDKNSNNANINNINKNKEEDDYFIMLGKSLTKYQITCDIFQIQINSELQNNQILINICNYSNGNLFFYKNFNIFIHYKNLFNTIIKSLSNQRAYEIIMQYNTSPNITIKQNLSIIPVQVNNSFLFPSIDINQTFSFFLEYKQFKSKENQELINSTKTEGDVYNSEEKELNEIFIQFSIIYTSLDGIRIIRIINKKIPVFDNKIEYIKNIDIESACCLMTKFLIKLLSQSGNVMTAMEEYKYKYFIFALSIFKQINLNELLSSFILCYLGIMKHKFFCLENVKYKINIDDMLAGRNNLLKMKIDDLLNVIVPKIYDITNVLNNSDNFENVFYQPVYLNKESILNDKVYLIDNGLFLNFYFTEGENNNKRLKIFFGENKTFDNVGKEFHSEKSVFEENINCDDFEVEKCKEIVDIIRNNKKNYYQDIFFSFSKSSSEALIKQCLILENYCPWFQYSYKDVFNKL